MAKDNKNHLDTNLRFDVVKMTALSTATKIKKSVDWKDVKNYGKRYDPDENAILEIKQETSKDSPFWIKQLLDKYDLEPVRMSKYVWSTYHSLDYTLGN
jgi:phenylalanyl-tRNA synthetase beta subunit